MEKHQFKPFDKVLVRDSADQKWKADFYSHYRNDNGYPHMCAGNEYVQCIPYNENTAHLVGTTESYKEPEPKVWYVENTDTGAHYEFTQSQFDHFIKDIFNSKEFYVYAIHRI